MTPRVSLPTIGGYELGDYKERVLPTGEGTGSQVRVPVESGDPCDRQGTVGVCEDTIEAGWQALVDFIAYKLLKGERTES